MTFFSSDGSFRGESELASFPYKYLPSPQLAADTGSGRQTLRTAFCREQEPSLDSMVSAIRVQQRGIVFLLVHKSLLGRMPEYISDLLTPVADIPARSALRASLCDNLVIPRTCRRISHRAFSVVAPRAWNRPTDLKLLWSRDSFRRKLKTFVFVSAFGHQGTCGFVP